MSGSATTAAVIGGGTMGVGIAHVLLAAGSRVTLVEADADRGLRAHDSVIRSLEVAETRGKLAVGESVQDVAKRLIVAPSVDDMPRHVSVVIEAVPEQIELKHRVLGAAAEHCCVSTVLATNTSSLSVAEIAKELPAQRVIGLHFFNPVPAQRLVEIVTHPGTSPEVLDGCRSLVDRLGKTPIVVDDSPGFATSRLGLVVGLEAIRMVEQGVASVEDVDTGMELGYRWPVGPLRLTDMIGLDVRLSIAEHLAAELGSRFDPPQLLRDKVDNGELGKKAGRGFYEWTE